MTFLLWYIIGFVSLLTVFFKEWYTGHHITLSDIGLLFLGSFFGPIASFFAFISLIDEFKDFVIFKGRKEK